MSSRQSTPEPAVHRSDDLTSDPVELQRWKRPGRAPVRVVIVDAHVRLLDTMARLLAASPWIEVIGTASSAAEGARVVRKWRPDVVLTDYRLPDVAGLDAIRLFKGFDRRTKVVVLSVSERADVKDAAHKAGVSAWVWKGGSLDQIIEAVLRVHGGSH